jgi:hypothetical protein
LTLAVLVEVYLTGTPKNVYHLGGDYRMTLRTAGRGALDGCFLPIQHYPLYYSSFVKAEYAKSPMF